MDEPERPKNPKELAKKWLDRLRKADAREEHWQNDAAEAEKAYLSDKHGDGPGRVPDFNILHSNVETIVPAIYNSTPVPDIRERFRVGSETPESEVARQVAQAIERAIQVQVDDGRLDTEVEGVVQDAFTAGRGIIRLRFDADVDGDSVSNERIVPECVSWRDYREGPAMRWRDVPWIAYGAWISCEEIERIRDPELRDKLGGDSRELETTLGPATNDEDVRTWEVWCKDTRKVYLIAEASEEIVWIQDDPLGLPGFFPQPCPIQPITGTGRRTPVCPYAVYRTLANELDTITRRINALLRICKARGLSVGDASELQKLAELDDGEIAPVSNLEQLAQTGGLDRAILWWPIENIIKVISELYVARDQTKLMIYEITGISDIVRGQGESGETATAQQIKTQWGSLRIKRLQRQVERCIRDLFVIYAEMICRHFDPMTVTRMTGVQIPPEGMEMFNKPLDHYRIDVESDSTVRADLTQRRGEMSEFIQGTAQYFGTMGPLVAEQPQAAAPAAEIYGAFARQFSLGKQAEDAIEQMVQGAKQAAQQPQQENPEQAQAALEMQKMQMEAQRDQANGQIEMQKAELEMQIKQIDIQLKRMDMALKQQEMQFKGASMVMEAENDTQEHEYNRETMDREHAMELQRMDHEARMRASEKASESD